MIDTLEPTDEPVEVLSSGQCRAGRSLVGMSQLELARRAKLSPCTVVAFERDESRPLRSTRRRLMVALVKSGLQFIVDERGRGVGVYLTRRPRRCPKARPRPTDRAPEVTQALQAVPRFT